MSETPAPAPTKSRGLEGVTALDTELSFIDGQKGELIYRGYGIQDLAQNASFEEVAYLLWKGDAPDPGPARRPQRADARRAPGPRRPARPPPAPHAQGRQPDGRHADGPVDALGLRRRGRRHGPRGQLPQGDPAHGQAARRSSPPSTGSARARSPSPRPSRARRPRTSSPCSTARRPGPAALQIMDAALVLHAEHGLNASTFACRVIGSTLSDMYSAVVGAMGALEGPAPRRRQHRGHEDAPRARRERRDGPGLRRPQAGEQGEDHGHRSPRLQDARPARDDPARHALGPVRGEGRA